MNGKSGDEKAMNRTADEFGPPS